MKIKKILQWLVGIAAAAYLLICFFLYYKQESIIFHPKKLPQDFKFSFEGARFEERNIRADDGTQLSGLLFKADTSRGLVFYLHGNAGALDTWGDVALIYNKMGYDVFMLDYRGFGKSGGSISSEEQFYNDIRSAYNKLKLQYAENKIVILGYSIGTGPAAMLAAETNCKMLVLLAPYYSLTDMMNQQFAFAPAFLLKYKFQTNRFLTKVKAPVVIFHGDADNVISDQASLKLKAYLKPQDRLIILKGQGHDGINANPEYLRTLVEVLRLGNIMV